MRHDSVTIAISASVSRLNSAGSDAATRSKSGRLAMTPYLITS